MRHFAIALGDRCTYTTLTEASSGEIFERFEAWCTSENIQEIWAYEPADDFARQKLSHLPIRWVENPVFLTSAVDWAKYRGRYNRLFMADFYKWQRLRLRILIEGPDQPVGGQWSYDAENRRALPRGHVAPTLWPSTPDSLTLEVIKTVRSEFPDHPGDANSFYLPVTYHEAREWLNDFLSHRLALFGDYEDAISSSQRTLYHSLLSPLLNCGLLTPQQIVTQTLAFSEENPVPINALEGFLRQVIGWREFIRGIDREYAINRQHLSNSQGATRRMKGCWYDGTTGLPPLDTAIQRARDFGYCHHIERLMILGSVMTMVEIHPDEVYRWFMEMFLDSADWVMRPNVYGMSQFADGGLFATKPYISGSNYVRKMSDYPKGDWCDVWDGLYWRYIDRHRSLFEKNPRMAIMTKALDNLDPHRREMLFETAEAFIALTTLESL